VAELSPPPPREWLGTASATSSRAASRPLGRLRTRGRRGGAVRGPHRVARPGTGDRRQARAASRDQSPGASGARPRRGRRPRSQDLTALRDVLRGRLPVSARCLSDRGGAQERRAPERARPGTPRGERGAAVVLLSPPFRRPRAGFGPCRHFHSAGRPTKRCTASSRSCLTLDVARVLDESPHTCCPSSSSPRRDASRASPWRSTSSTSTAPTCFAWRDPRSPHAARGPACARPRAGRGRHSRPSQAPRIRAPMGGDGADVGAWAQRRLLLALRGSEPSLADVAHHGAAAMELACGYIDVFDAARRRNEMNPAAEIQQSLLPPRIVRLGGAELGGSVLPSYDVGGDWFDYVESPDGAWIAIADAAGKGPTAGGLGSVALAALRAATRRASRRPRRACTRRCMPSDSRSSSSPIVARWSPAYSILTWVNAGTHHRCSSDPTAAAKSSPPSLSSHSASSNESAGPPEPPPARARGPGRALHRRDLAATHKDQDLRPRRHHPGGGGQRALGQGNREGDPRSSRQRLLRPPPRRRSGGRPRPRGPPTSARR
jgi:hypothetical protein